MYTRGNKEVNLIKYNPNEWAKLKAQVEQNEKYGENTPVIEHNLKKIKKQPIKHSFPHLLNVTFPIPIHNLRQFPEDNRSTYRISDNQRGQYAKLRTSESQV